MIPIVRPAFDWRELIAALLPRRHAVQVFEEALARTIGRKYCVAFSYGRRAIWHYVRAASTEGERFVVPAYTCIVVPHAISLAGHPVDFVDTDDGFNASFAAFAQRGGHKVVTHLFGIGVPAASADDSVVEDACLALGLRVGGRPAGCLGRASFFSFNRSKSISTIEGGCIATDDPTLYQALKNAQATEAKPSLRHTLKLLLHLCLCYILYSQPAYGLLHRVLLRRRRAMLDSWNFATPALPRDSNVRFTDLQAKIGLVQLQKLPWILERRRRIAHLYETLITHPKVTKPAFSAESIPTHYPLRVSGSRRESFVRALEDAGVRTGSAFDYCCPATPYYAQSGFPNAVRLAAEVVNIPIYASMRTSDVEHVARCVNEAGGVL